MAQSILNVQLGLSGIRSDSFVFEIEMTEESEEQEWENLQEAIQVLDPNQQDSASVALSWTWAERGNSSSSIAASYQASLRMSDISVQLSSRSRLPDRRRLVEASGQGGHPISLLVLVELELDHFPEETGWRIHLSMDNSTSIIDRPVGTYREGDRFVTERVTLQVGVEYTFELLDSAGDGLCCLSPTVYQVSLYSPQEDDVDGTSKVIVSGGGADFGVSQSKNFTVAAHISGSDTPPPTPLPPMPNNPTDNTMVSTTLTVYVEFDDFAFENRWELVQAASNRTVATGGPYPLTTSTTTEFVSVNIGEDYRFAMIDDFGDGMAAPSGSFYVLDSTGRILVEGHGDFGFASSTTFSVKPSTLDIEEGESSTPVAFPTVAPTNGLELEGRLPDPSITDSTIDLTLSTTNVSRSTHSWSLKEWPTESVLVDNRNITAATETIEVISDHQYLFAMVSIGNRETKVDQSIVLQQDGQLLLQLNGVLGSMDLFFAADRSSSVDPT